MENLQSLLQQLEEEIVREQEFAKTMPTEAGLTYAAYASVAIDRREDLHRRIKEQEGHVAQARELLRAAYLELKKYEIAEERREAKITAEEAKAEQQALDEIGLTAHIRKG